MGVHFLNCVLTNSPTFALTVMPFFTFDFYLLTLVSKIGLYKCYLAIVYSEGYQKVKYPQTNLMEMQVQIQKDIWKYCLEIPTQSQWVNIEFNLNVTKFDEEVLIFRSHRIKIMAALRVWREKERTQSHQYFTLISIILNYFFISTFFTVTFCRQSYSLILV